eukprot:gb/GFBE01040660.1/.p1 GENE.gb/GFBE01040660.1/~~gb/GFBE01040660.1/.p1  ORF type:complete len:168 (+),score=12.73 gb/GFBE01040660.1/:1-504(+)
MAAQQLPPVTGRGGALGWHTPSAGRSHALKRLQSTGTLHGRDNNEDWLQNWTSHPHPYGPMAMNLHLREPPAPSQKVTWQTLRDPPWQRQWQTSGIPKEMLESHAADGLSKSSTIGSAFPGGRFAEGAAGAPSGGHELCSGRLGLLNGGRPREMQRSHSLSHFRTCP